MKIVGFGFKKISSERKKEIKGELKINTNLSVKDIAKEKIDFAGEVLKFSWIFSVAYDPGFAEVLIEGECLVIPEDIKNILKDWKKKKIQDTTRIPLFNFIMSKCNLKALQLEEELSLPPHIPMPQLRPQQPTPQNPQQQGKANYAG